MCPPGTAGRDSRSIGGRINSTSAAQWCVAGRSPATLPVAVRLLAVVGDAVMRAERQARMRRTPGILDTGTPVGMAIG